VLVAVPEGLPLAIGIALAYAVTNLRREKVLVKNLEAPEIMARVNTVISGKTGTLTQEQLSVAYIHA